MTWAELIKKLAGYGISLRQQQRVLLSRGLRSAAMHPPYDENDMDIILDIIRNIETIPTWGSFKKYLGRRGVKLTHKEWGFLRDELRACAVHEPFDETDIYFAIGRVKEIRSLLDG